VAFLVGRRDDAFLGLNIDLGCKKEYISMGALKRITVT